MDAKKVIAAAQRRNIDALAALVAEGANINEQDSHKNGDTMNNESEDKRLYKVVVNHEEQYSIWFADRELPAGWTADGTTGTKQECLEHIDRVWTDMRPLSLRKKMDQPAAL